MITTLTISSITCILIIVSILFFPKVKIGNISLSTYWLISLLGAIFILIFKCIDFSTLFSSLTTNSSINPLKIIVLFFSMTLLSIYLDEVGFFRFLANNASRIAKSNQFILFIILYLLVSVLTVFTSNDIVILTFTPFICYFCKNSKVDPIPYLVSEFVAANTWSMMLIIGNPTNIYLATSSNISFIEYTNVMFLPTVLAGLTELCIIMLIFKKKLSKKMDFMPEDLKLDNIPKLSIGLFHLSICLVLLIISSYIKIEMWIVSLSCAVSLVICTLIFSLFKHQSPSFLVKTTKRLPFELIPFILSMFTIVTALNEQGISEWLSNFLGESHVILKYGVSSFVTCNLINNIPMSVLFSTLPNMVDPINQSRAIYSTIIGSNLGAFLTPIGALAGIMFTSLLSKYEVKYSFKTFVKYGIIISIPTLIVALSSLLITIK